jgi:hypothetical protein
VVGSIPTPSTKYIMEFKKLKPQLFVMTKLQFGHFALRDYWIQKLLLEDREARIQFNEHEMLLSLNDLRYNYNKKYSNRRKYWSEYYQKEYTLYWFRWNKAQAKNINQTEFTQFFDNEDGK